MPEHSVFIVAINATGIALPSPRSRSELHRESFRTFNSRKSWPSRQHRGTVFSHPRSHESYFFFHLSLLLSLYLFVSFVLFISLSKCCFATATNRSQQVTTQHRRSI